MARSILIYTESLMLVPEHIFLLLRLFYQRKPPCTLWRWLVRDTALVYSVMLWSIHPNFTHRSYGKHRYPKSSTWAKAKLWENLQFVKSEQEEILMIRRKFIYAQFWVIEITSWLWWGWSESDWDWIFQWHHSAQEQRWWSDVVSCLCPASHKF